jgi:signal transduction histidine kinase
LPGFRERALAMLELGVSGPDVTPELRRRIRVLSIATAAMLSIGMTAIAHFQHLEMWRLCGALIVTMSAALANLVLLRHSRRAQLCGHIGLSLLASLLLFSNLTSGGFYDANFAWFYLLPITAAVLLDVRGAAIWTGVTLTIMLVFWSLPELGFELTNHIPADARNTTALFNRATAIVGVGLLAGSFVVGEKRTVRELARAYQDLSRETAYSQLLEHAATTANEATSFEQALREAVSRICTTMGWAAGHACNVSDAGEISSTGETHSTGERFVALVESSISVKLRRGEGLAGRVAASGRPERLDLTDALQPRAALAREAGIQSAFAVPVFVNGKVRAVLEFASETALPDDGRLLEVFSHIGVQLGRVAERTALQDRLRQSQKMEAVGQLAAGLAHEINNPMSYVRSNLNRLSEEWASVRTTLEKADLPEPEDSSELCEELIGECLEGIERTVAIVREVQEFSHVGAERGSVDLVGVIDSALRVAMSRAGSGVKIQTDDVVAIAGLVGSANQLRQILVNLVVNAIHAVGETGVIRISTARAGEEAVIRVEDDGPGISPEVSERLFEPFFTTKPVGLGTGLGLYVSYEIAKNHGGEIRVDSTLGSGTAFEVRLPLDRA